MKNFKPESIRNVALFSHSGDGKTTLTEAALFKSGVINRLGKADEGTTVSDFDDEEIKRKISINLTPAPFEWKETKINLLDTPGYADFAGETKAALRIAEGALILVSAVSGVAVGTEQVWNYCEEGKLPRIIIVNKMDRENANFGKAVASLEERLGRKCLPLQMPIGAALEFEGYIDLITQKAYKGSLSEEIEIPDNLKEEAASYREKLIEAIAEVDDVLIEKYLGGEELTFEEIENGLKKAVAQADIAPVIAVSALKGVGIDYMLDKIIELVPSASSRREESEEGEILEAKVDSPLAALVYKTTADPYVGKLTYFRVFSGTIKSNSHIWNITHEADERIGQLFMIRGKAQEPVDEVAAGDIGAVAKLNVSATGDTLSEQGKKLNIKKAMYPKPFYSEAVYPKTKEDVDKLGSALVRLTEEDPTIQVHRDSETHETIVSGLGETQISVVAAKMEKKFGVSVDLVKPKVPYRETVMQKAKGEHKHKKQSGGHGQYGHVMLEVEPLPRGSGIEFVNSIVGGAIPKNYIPSVEKGINEAVSDGVLIGMKVVDLKVNLYDGSFHPVDSSDICFKIAGSHALKKAMQAASPVILEPIMNMKIIAPSDNTGDVIGDLNTKRAHVQGMNPEDGVNIIDAQVPLAEVQKYAIDLKSLTQGRGRYSMEFDHYAELPLHLAQKLIEEKEKEKQEKE